ncbi:hypothetical protein Mgra_00004591, partial [Meloidogyne graminicola]
MDAPNKINTIITKIREHHEKMEELSIGVTVGLVREDEVSDEIFQLKYYLN